jgi:hypothetical protein
MKMKMKKSIGAVVGVLLLLTALNSCVKNRNTLGTDFSKISPLIELPDNGVIVLAYEVTTVPQVNNITVNYAFPSPAPNDITITLALDPAGLAAYDTANQQLYTMLPDSAFTFTTKTVTIPKGANSASVTFSVVPSKVDLSLSNALAFKITDAQGINISQNFQSVIYPIVVKNPYDGDYTVTGWFFHPTAGRAISAVKHLSTINAIRMEGGVGDLGTPFQFDIVDNKLVNWFSDGFTSSSFMTQDNPGATDYTDASNGGHLPGDGTFNKTIYNNTYDPATKTFYLHYGYRNGAVGDQSIYTRQIYEKWVKK